MLAVHLVNTLGYYFIYEYFIGRADEQLVQQLDNDEYHDSGLIELKLALHLPYMNSSEYTRIEGEIELDGIHYNYVKRKIANDTLYLLCLPNLEKTKLVEERNEYASNAADAPAKGQDANAGKKIQPYSEYNFCAALIQPEYDFELISLLPFQLTPQLANPYIGDSFQPPELITA